MTFACQPATVKSQTYLGGCYVTAPSNVMNLFRDFCSDRQVPFSQNFSVISPDPSTLFTTSGMQKHKPFFLNPSHTGVMCDVQRCLRLNDLDEVGDGTHYLDFHMLGLFSFRQWSVPDGIEFWMSFLTKLNLRPDVVTIHPDCPSWRSFYDIYGVEVRFDPECIWSDGTIGGYCTEFYKDEVEIGNIVNPLGDCLDCGFGLERLEMLLGQDIPSKEGVLLRTIHVLLESGVTPSNQKQGYVLRRLIRQLSRESTVLNDHSSVWVQKELQRLCKIQQTLPRLLKKHPHESKTWFWETHGIHPDDWG